MSPSDTLWQVTECIENCPSKIALVIESSGRLLGTITDGDIRRALLRGKSMDISAEIIMNKQPVTMSVGTDMKTCLMTMERYNLRQLPLIDQEKKVVKLLNRQDVELHKDQHEKDKIPVIIMAGGKGKRLRPLTEDCPKPMLPVGDKPLLEVIIEQLGGQGFSNFYISINYLGDMIKNYFGNGDRFNVSIQYLEESEPLGTAGPLGLLKTAPHGKIVVINGDVLTRMYLPRLLDFHDEHDADATMCVREYEIQVPYGTVDLEADKVTNIEEKPVYRFFVNAGIYVLDKNIISLIEDNESTDMVSLLKRAKKANYQIAAFPIHEYWLDIGRMDDLARAQEEIFGILSPKDF